MSETTTVYLADLTYTGPVLSSNVFPLAAGLIGAQLMESLPGVRVELFKYPQDLAAAIQRETPKIVGFSNYSWNCNISYQFASRIKARFPEAVVVFGGPNYGLEPEEREAFWRRYPLIDFYVVKEGELAMVELARTLARFDNNVGALKRSGTALPNCHYTWEGALITGDLMPRMKDLDQLPSPYLAGLMDKFFDQVLSPMVHTTRGCPFMCTFCTEGADYYSKVAQRASLGTELEYIAERVGTVPDLYLSDANFGMYKQDVAKAEVIAALQKRYQWPKRLVVSTGKNQKERIVEVAGMLAGAMNIAASLQSTDVSVLQNIKRTNISVDALNTMARQSNGAKTDTFTEVILGLPGDTREKHTQTLRDVVNADMGIVRMFQLIMLHQTELNTPDVRRRYGMKTKHRIMPRSHGRYQLVEESFVAIESEEICVENDTLSFDDYVECRELNLTVEVVHNGRVFAELQGFCEWIGQSWFDFMLRFHNRRRSSGSGLAALYDRFRSETTGRLWDSREELEAYVEQHLDQFTTEDSSTNEMANAKVNAFFNLQDVLHDVLFDEMALVLAERGRDSELLILYLQELKAYSRSRKLNIVDYSAQVRGVFHFDFQRIASEDFRADPQTHFNEQPAEYHFRHTVLQAELIEGYLNQYGRTLDGLGRILMRVWPTKRLFREACVGS